MNATHPSEQQSELWLNIISGASTEGVLRIAMRQVAHNLTEMIRRPFETSKMRIETIPINRLTAYTDDPEAETVGIYLLSGDDLPGQAILILSLNDARQLVDWLLKRPPGASVKLDSLERSVLAEIGNLTLSSFLNAVAVFTGKHLRPSPPAVMVDMLAAVLETVVTAVAAVTDELLIIETDFVNVESSLSIRFWLLPDPIVLSADRIKMVKATDE